MPENTGKRTVTIRVRDIRMVHDPERPNSPGIELDVTCLDCGHDQVVKHCYASELFMACWSFGCKTPGCKGRFYFGPVAAKFVGPANPPPEPIETA
jgi:ribosomal protein S27E